MLLFVVPVHHLVYNIFGFLGVEGGPATNFWGGFASDLSEFALLGGILSLVRKNNCEVRHCFRLGRHTTAANHHVCHRHHPSGAPSAQEVVDAHNKAKSDNA
jgi:hypothetical protein